jgi:hypothetical protein
MMLNKKQDLKFRNPTNRTVIGICFEWSNLTFITKIYKISNCCSNQERSVFNLIGVLVDMESREA